MPEMPRKGDRGGASGDPPGTANGTHALDLGAGRDLDIGAGASPRCRTGTHPHSQDRYTPSTPPDLTHRPPTRYKTLPARSLRRPTRYKTLPARSLRRPTRYKTLPARPKYLFSAHFAPTGRVLYRFHHHQTEQGEKSHAPKPHLNPVTRTSLNFTCNSATKVTRQHELIQTGNMRVGNCLRN